MKRTDIIGFGIGLILLGLPAFSRRMEEATSAACVVLGLALIVACGLDVMKDRRKAKMLQATSVERAAAALYPLQSRLTPRWRRVWLRLVRRSRPSAPSVSRSEDQSVVDSEFDRGFHLATVDRAGALLDLTKLRGNGVRIRNEIPAFLSSDQLNAWVDDTLAWMRAVRETLEVVNAADAVWFETLDTVPAARVPIPGVRLGGAMDRERFAGAFRQHDYRLVRLDKLLQKYGVGVSTI